MKTKPRCRMGSWAGFAATAVAAAMMLGATAVAQAPGPPSPPVLPRGATRLPGVPTATEATKSEDSGAALKFNMATVDIVLNDYSEKTGRTLLLAPDLPKATITLRSQGVLSMEEYLQAIDTVLAMNKIVLLEAGDRFLKAVPITRARQEAMGIQGAARMEPHPEKGRLVSQMIALHHVELGEAKKAIDALRHQYGAVHVFENINSVMVTDDQANINRILEVIRLIDQPIEVREEPNIINILHAKPSEIKSKLMEIIAESQKQQQKASVVPRQATTGQPGVVRPSARTPPGVIRARRPAARAAAIPELALIAEAERGIIRGRVQIVADDRTGILIIITRPENMNFFEKIIKVLDVETAPDVMIKVFRLEYATAEEVAGMLNDLIGAASKDDTGSTAVKPATEKGEASALRDYVERIEKLRQAEPGKSKVGELAKENIKILSDKRTNSLIIMASRWDLVALEEIIRDMDMMLLQVLIEAAILDIQLTDSLNTGIDWLQNSMIAFNDEGAGVRTPILAFSGAGGGGKKTPFDVTAASAPGGASGLSYYLTYFGLNLDMVLTMAASDTRARVVSTPVILTTDNTEAKITSTELMYVFSGTTRRGTTEGGDFDNYDRQEVGLELVVKPHINENKVVMMDITQKLSQPTATEGINRNELTGTVIYSSRTMEAAIAVANRHTIVLGGLVSDRLATTKSGIPLLSSIPLVGRLFGADTKTKTKTETIVFITPYVLDTPAEAVKEAKRRKDSVTDGKAWKKGWTDSDLAHPETLDRPPAPDADKKPPAGKDEKDADPQVRSNTVGPGVRDDLRDVTVTGTGGELPPVAVSHPIVPTRTNPEAGVSARPAATSKGARGDSALAQRQRELAARQAVLDRKERELGEAEKRGQLVMRQRAQEIELAKKEEELAARELELNEKEIKLQQNDLEQQVQEREQAQAVKAKELTDRLAELTKRALESEKQRLTDELRLRQREIAARERELVEKERVVLALEREVGELESDRDVKPAALKEKDPLSVLDPTIREYVRKRKGKQNGQTFD